MRNITNERLWEGIVLSASSAEDLFQAGDEIARSGKTGIATSLVILSAEESVKAMGLLAYGLANKSNDDFVKPLFYSHSAKHEFAKGIMFMVRLLQMFVEEIYDVQDDECIPENKKPSVFVDRMVNRASENVSGTRSDFDDLLFWQGTANDLKKRGFYVEWHQEKWNTPNSIDHETYQDVRGKAHRLIDVVKSMVEVGGIAQIQERIALASKQKT